jgi:hypothetical protein
MVKGQAVREAREARESGIIQKVERPLWANHEYTFRRVDRRHPRRPTHFTWGKESPKIETFEERIAHFDEGTPVQQMVWGF